MITTKNENKYVSCKPGGSYSAVLSFWVIPPVYQVIFSQINVLYFLSLSCSFLWFRHVWVTSFVLGYNFPLVQEIPCTLSMWKYLPVFLNSNYRCNTKGLSRTQSPWLSQIPIQWLWLDLCPWGVGPLEVFCGVWLREIGRGCFGAFAEVEF